MKVEDTVGSELGKAHAVEIFRTRVKRRRSLLRKLLNDNCRSCHFEELINVQDEN